MEGVSNFTLHCLSSKVTSHHVTFEQEQLISYLPSMDLQWAWPDVHVIESLECTYGLGEIRQPLVRLGPVRGIHLLIAVKCVQRLQNRLDCWFLHSFSDPNTSTIERPMHMYCAVG